jgi:UrcA family protein
MNKFDTVFAAALVIASSMAAAPSHAASSNEPALVVKFQDLNLSTADGSALLYSRLQSASRAVCEPLNGRELQRVKQYHECYEKALSEAVKGVNSTQRTNLTAWNE